MISAPWSWAAFLVLVTAALPAVALVLPVRGGTGEHAHAGPGTVTVDDLRAALPAPAGAADPADEEIIWPEHDWPEHDWPEPVGRHRLVTDEVFCHRLATSLALREHRGPSHTAGCRFPTIWVHVEDVNAARGLAWQA